jgi:hypothetical protein
MQEIYAIAHKDDSLASSFFPVIDSSINKSLDSEITYYSNKWPYYDGIICPQNAHSEKDDLIYTQDEWNTKKFPSTIWGGSKASSDVIWEVNRPDQASLFEGSTADISSNVLDFQSRIVKRPRPTTTKGRFLLLQQWEGYVLKVNEDTFTALVYDQTNPKNDPEEVELIIEEVSLFDHPLLQDGAVFYWSIGYNDQANGQRVRSSIIRFRRVPAWSRKDLKKIKEKASALYSFLESNNNDSLDEYASG